MIMPFRLNNTIACAIAISITASDAALCGEYSPIDCIRANDAVQKTICRDYPLGQAEARMATLYSVITSLVPMGGRSTIQDAQREWLRNRDACHDDKVCLASAYSARIRDLEAAMADIASRGPF